jgi:hypothetical protein
MTARLLGEARRLLEQLATTGAPVRDQGPRGGWGP